MEILTAITALVTSAVSLCLLGGFASIYARCVLHIMCHVRFVWTLSQGIKQTDHFGFICRDQAESGPSQYVCYVFQCASESLVSNTEHVKWLTLLQVFLSRHKIYLNHYKLLLAACLGVAPCTRVRWTRWWWPWSRLLAQLQPCKAARPRSNYVRPAPCMTCTNSVSGLKVFSLKSPSSPGWLMNILMYNLFLWELKRDKWELSYPFLFPGLYPPRAKLAIQKYLSQLTDNEQVEIFERVQVRYSCILTDSGDCLIETVD